MLKFSCSTFHRCLIQGTLIITIILAACGNSPGENKNTPGKEPSKPDGINAESLPGPADTLVISQQAAVFFTADSARRESLKKQIGENPFDGVDHECFYQMKNARTSLREHWPQIRIYEVKDTLIILFIRKNATPRILDLRIKKDLCGLYLFSPEKDPISGDMMNIGTSLESYFTR
ncbi:MAG: hypothetical protein ACO25B_00645 [Chitinophagaceae bacterium]